MKTSQKLAVLLALNGFKQESSLPAEYILETELEKMGFPAEHAGYYNFYDILNDLCVTYAGEIFGGTVVPRPPSTGQTPLRHYTCMILGYLQIGQQELAEDFLWDHCLFNPKNK